jgi:hypothetical protein
MSCVVLQGVRDVGCLLGADRAGSGTNYQTLGSHAFFGRQHSLTYLMQIEIVELCSVLSNPWCPEGGEPEAWQTGYARVKDQLPS